MLAARIISGLSRLQHRSDTTFSGRLKVNNSLLWSGGEGEVWLLKAKHWGLFDLFQ